MARTKAFNPEQALLKARDLFWQQGYEATSMQELVSAMGLSRSSIYDTFGDKHQLYQAALQRYAHSTKACHDSVLAEAVSGKQTIAAIFNGLVAAAVDQPNQRGCFMVNSAVEMCPHNATIAEIVDESLGMTELFFADLVRQGQAVGEIADELDAQKIGRFLLNSLVGLRVMVKTNKDRQTLEDIVQTSLAILG